MQIRAMWRAGNGSRQLLVACVAATLAAATLALSIIYVAVSNPAPAWDPLGDYPTQTVVHKRVRLGGMVEVLAKKCADETVQVTGVTRWQSVEPPGTIIVTGSGTATRKAGCETFHFSNPIPESVVSVVRSGGPRIWTISGTETPLEDGGQGVPRAWQTERFEVVP